MAGFNGAVLHGVDEARRRHDFASGMHRDLELAASRLADFLCETSAHRKWCPATSGTPTSNANGTAGAWPMTAGRQDGPPVAALAAALLKITTLHALS